MAAKKGTTPITLNIFKAAKILLSSGSTQREVAEYLSISPSSVQKINKAEDFDDYKRITNAWYVAKLVKEKEQKEKEQKEKELKEKELKEKESQEQAPTQVSGSSPVQVVEHRQSVTIQATHFMTEEMKRTNELLTLINNKLGAIINDLYGIKG